MFNNIQVILFELFLNTPSSVGRGVVVLKNRSLSREYNLDKRMDMIPRMLR